MRIFPRQYWYLVGGTLFYLIVTGLAFPYTAVLIRARLNVSVGVVGLILGGTALAGLPLQLAAGALSDRLGRRSVMILCAAAEACMYGGLAFVRAPWLVVLCVFADRALGWPMYLTASNAMVADLTRQRLRAEGFAIVRLVIGAGTVIGPLISALFLGIGFSIPFLFALAGTGCVVFFVFTLTLLAETKPAAGKPAAAHRVGKGWLPRWRGLSADAQHAVLSVEGAAPEIGQEATAPATNPGAGGYREVFGNRAFLLFCLVSLIPLFIFGQLYSTYPILATSVLRVHPSLWGLLLSVSAAVIVVLQYPVVRWLKRFDGRLQIALACVLFGVGTGAAPFVGPGWPLFVLIALFGLAQVIFSPVSVAVVSQMAPQALRGRYMGAWTLVWTAGLSALGPLGGGFLMDVAGPRLSYAMILALGVVGAGLFVALYRHNANVSSAA